MRVLFIVLFFVSSLLPLESSAMTPRLKNEFISSCLAAFKKSGGPETAESGRHICKCAAGESKRQGASDAAILKEARAIRTDPKHEIHDPHVLDAFHYCAIEEFRSR